MEVVVKLSEMAFFVICMLLSPVSDGENIYIDVIESNKLESVQLIKRGENIDCVNSFDESKVYFSLKKIEDEKAVYSLKSSDGEVETIDLLEFLSEEELRKLLHEKNNLTFLEVIDGSNINIKRVGGTTYVHTDDFKNIIAAIHE